MSKEQEHQQPSDNRAKPDSEDHIRGEQPVNDKPDTKGEKETGKYHCNGGVIKVETTQKDSWNIYNRIALASFIVGIGLGLFALFNFLEYKRQFKVINSPRLAIGYIEVPKRIVGKQFTIRYYILSLTRNAVHIYGSKYFFSFDVTRKEDIMNKIGSLPTDYNNTYTLLEYPLTVTKVLSDKLSKKDSASFQDGSTTFLNEFEYYNTIDNCWATYIFAARLKIGPENRVIEVYYNENRDTVFCPNRKNPSE